jgi:hypothetical protein
MADSALIAAGGDDAPLSYLVPGATAIRIKQIHVAYVDNSASGDWLPAVRIVSDSKHTMGLASDQGVIVTAGNDAGVTFFPGVKHAPAGISSAFLNQSRLFQKLSAPQAIPSGVLTALVFDSDTFVPGYTPGLFGSTPGVQNPVTFGDFGVGVFMLVVTFPAAAYDRYIELTIANPDTGGNSVSPRLRSQISPDGDRLALTALIDGDPTNPTTVTANVFQASGVNRNVTAEWEAIDVHGRIFLV